MTWRKCFVQRPQSHFDFYFCVFDLKDSKDELVLIASGTLLWILGAIYKTVSVPYLTVPEFLE